MSVKFFDVFTKTDWAKIIILLVVAAISCSLVYREYQKPLFPPGWETENPVSGLPTLGDPLP